VYSDHGLLDISNHGELHILGYMVQHGCLHRIPGQPGTPQMFYSPVLNYNVLSIYAVTRLCLHHLHAQWLESLTSKNLFSSPRCWQSLRMFYVSSITPNVRTPTQPCIYRQQNSWLPVWSGFMLFSMSNSQLKFRNCSHSHSDSHWFDSWDCFRQGQAA